MKSTHAGAASAIRKELKTAFPSTKFSVTSEVYAGGSSVRIKWENGPTKDQVETITKKYQYGSFNGMIDLYENFNLRSDIPQVKYVTTDREYSDEILNEAFEKFKKMYPEFRELTDIYQNTIDLWGSWQATRASEVIYRFLYEKDLTHGVVELNHSDV